MDEIVSHPVFGYRISYRRVLAVQARLFTASRRRAGRVSTVRDAFVTYDISDDRRRTSVYSLLRGYGDHLQFSVFRWGLIGSSPRGADRSAVRTTQAIRF